MKKIIKIICLLLCSVILFTANISGVQAAAVTVSATTKLTATATADTVTLNWKKVSKATGYRVYRIVNGKLKTVKTLKKNKYTVEDLTAGETYKFAVKTYRTQNGKTYWSSKYKSVTVKTKAMAKPAKPTATSTKNTVTLKWKEVAGATGYRVFQYKNGEWVKIKTLTANTFKVSSLKENKTYKFKIRPYAKTTKKTVWGSFSSVVTIQTIDKTKAKFTTPVIGTKGVTLNWGKVSGASGYRLNMLVDGEWVKVAGGIKGTSYKVDRLESGTEYTFFVRAYKYVNGKINWFTKSDTITITTKKVETPTTTVKPSEESTTENQESTTETKPGTTDTTATTTTKPTTTKPDTSATTTTKPTTTQQTTTKPTTTQQTTTQQTTTKPTTTQQTTTKPTTTQQTTTKPTTTKPTTTQEQLTAYRIAKYKTILDKETVYFKISSELDGVMIPVEFAMKNGNMVFDTNMPMEITDDVVLDSRLKTYYDKKTNKMTAYVEIMGFWAYYDVPKEEMADMDMTEMLEELRIKNLGDVSVMRTKFNNKSVIRESYFDSATGYTMYYYFEGEKLIGIEKEHPKKADEVIYVETISNTIPSGAFNKPEDAMSLDLLMKMLEMLG